MNKSATNRANPSRQLKKRTKKCNLSDHKFSFTTHALWLEAAMSGFKHIFERKCNIITKWHEKLSLNITRQTSIEFALSSEQLRVYISQLISQGRVCSLYSEFLQHHRLLELFRRCGIFCFSFVCTRKSFTVDLFYE